MPVKIKSYNQIGVNQPEWVENGFENREVTVDNITFHTGMNQTRNFADDGVGLANVKSGSNIVTDTIPFNDARS